MLVHRLPAVWWVAVGIIRDLFVLHCLSPGGLEAAIVVRADSAVRTSLSSYPQGWDPGSRRVIGRTFA